MRRIVLDTNCLLQSLPSSSPYHKIWADILDGQIQLCVNTEILNEYEEIISSKTTREIAHNVVEAIARLSTTLFQDSFYHFGLITSDTDDNKFVDCAIAANAEYIVTNDKHFDVLKNIPWPKLAVITIIEFRVEFYSNNTFENNTAFLYAGAIGTNNSKIINNTFTNNNAYQAGAILTINSTIHNNTFSGNDATRAPSVGYIDNYNYTVSSYYVYYCSSEDCSGCTACESCTSTIIDPITGAEIKVINCSNGDVPECICEDSVATLYNISLLYNNEGLNLDEDVYVYDESTILRVALNNNDMYFLYENASIPNASEYHYWAYCIEQNNSKPWQWNGTTGVLVDDLYFVRNSLDGSYVGDYIKVLVSYFYFNLDEDVYNLSLIHISEPTRPY